MFSARSNGGELSGFTIVGESKQSNLTDADLLSITSRYGALEDSIVGSNMLSDSTVVSANPILGLTAPVSSPAVSSQFTSSPTSPDMMESLRRTMKSDTAVSPSSTSTQDDEEEWLTRSMVKAKEQGETTKIGYVTQTDAGARTPTSIPQSVIEESTPTRLQAREALSSFLTKQRLQVPNVNVEDQLRQEKNQQQKRAEEAARKLREQAETQRVLDEERAERLREKEQTKKLIEAQEAKRRADEEKLKQEAEDLRQRENAAKKQGEVPNKKPQQAEKNNEKSSSERAANILVQKGTVEAIRKQLEMHGGLPRGTKDVEKGYMAPAVVEESFFKRHRGKIAIAILISLLAVGVIIFAPAEVSRSIVGKLATYTDVLKNTGMNFVLGVMDSSINMIMSGIAVAVLAGTIISRRQQHKIPAAPAMPKQLPIRRYQLQTSSNSNDRDCQPKPQNVPIQDAKKNTNTQRMVR